MTRPAIAEPQGMDTFRNRLAWRIANFALNHIADERYREGVRRVIWRGMAAGINNRRKATTP